MLPTSDLDYALPEDRVATHPVQPRDSAKMMVVRRSDPSRVEHLIVRDLPRLLTSEDVLVVNATRVIPARLLGQRADTGGAVEGLFLGHEGEHGGRAGAAEPGSPLGSGNSPGADRAVTPAPRPADALAAADASGGDRWRVMLRGRRLKRGIYVNLHDQGGRDTGVRLKLIDRSGEEGEETAWLVQVEGLAPGERTVAVLERIGSTPLPPYIRAARKRQHEEEIDEADRDAYQTVYAQHDYEGSVAAPTAGLHFTPDLMLGLQSQGVQRAEVVLQVGSGTFRPVETEYVEQHRMHPEWCAVPEATARLVRASRETRRGRVIAVGTTAARTLESFGPSSGWASPLEGWTRLMITPGHAWQNTDALLTNFHLPRSTLMAMVAALLPGGVVKLRELYQAALGRGYRFYSYGDAMLVLP